MTIKDLNPTEFENLAYDLVVSLGLTNAVWRTPGRDGGRDIEGQFTTVDLSGYLQTQKWYVECKKYESAVDWPTVHEKIAYADSNSADFLLMVAAKGNPDLIRQVFMNLFDNAVKYGLPNEKIEANYWIKTSTQEVIVEILGKSVGFNQDEDIFALGRR